MYKKYMDQKYWTPEWLKFSLVVVQIFAQKGVARVFINISKAKALFDDTPNLKVGTFYFRVSE